MKASLRLVFAITGVALLGFAVHDMVSFGMSVFSSGSHAPRELWDALGDAVTWGIEYKVGVTVAFIVCLTVLYVRRVPALKSK
jgi:hypothetical protein